MLWKRHGVWAIIGVIALTSSVAPLFDTSTCNVDTVSSRITEQLKRTEQTIKITPHSAVTDSFGQHFVGTVVVAILFAVLLDPEGRYRRDKVTHVWMGRYAMVLGTSCLIVHVRAWLFALCPGDGSKVLDIWHLLFVFLTVTNFMSVAITLYLMVLRLRYAEHEAARRSLFLVHCMLGTVVVFSSCIVLLRIIGVKQELFYFFMFFFTTFVVFTLVVAFGWTATRAFWVSACTIQMVEGKRTAMAARWMRITAGFVIAFVVSTIAKMTTLAALWVSRRLVGEQYWTRLTIEIVHVVDLISKVACNLLCAGFLGPEDGVEAAASLVGAERRARQIRAKLLEAARSKTGVASTLANMMEGKDSNTLLSEAIARFRCISWDVLEKQRGIIVQATRLDGTAAPADLYTLSKPCDIGDCDVFLSHSWHDNAQQKWDALSDWCEAFKLQHCRSPNLWLDKVCINQANITEDLQCLPIFLAACNRFLILSGPTYTSRLWCVVELFVYVHMLDDDEAREMPTIITLGSADESRQTIMDAWQQFDAASCNCFNPKDKVRIMKIVESCPGGILGFNNRVRWLASNFLGAPQTTSVSLAATPRNSLSEPIEQATTMQIIGVQAEQTISASSILSELCWTEDTIMSL